MSQQITVKRSMTMVKIKNRCLNQPLPKKLINICILLALAFTFTISKADAQNNPVRFVWKKLEVEGQGPFADREFVSLVYDSKRNRLILFGGGLHGRNYNDIWAVDLDKNTWSKIEAIGPSGEIPEPRAMHSAAYIPESDRMVVFGSDGTGLMFADYDVYSFDFKTGRWSVIKAQGEHHPRMVRTSMLYLA